MTQKQRMEQGLIYDPTADEIMNEQTGVAQYLKEYNSLGLGGNCIIMSDKHDCIAFAVNLFQKLQYLFTGF